MERREDMREDHERIWSSIEELKTKMATVETKTKSIEDLMNNQTKFCQMELNRWEGITNRLSAHDAKIMDRFNSIEKLVENISYRLNFIESTPGKVIAFVVGVIAIGGGVWAIIRHWLRAEIAR